jgi:rSAM/selenodomain-associated transferase 1
MSAGVDDSLGIVVFARAPEPGQAKTRLIPALGPLAAARLQANMTRHALASACRANVGEVQLWCSPQAQHPHFQECATRFRVTLHTQHGADLGERLQHAHDSAFARCDRVLIMGTDCPALIDSVLREAACDIARHDALIIPAEDGGYVLLGLSRPCKNAFHAIAWGSAQVCEQTLQRLEASGLAPCVYGPLWDVDRPDDLARLETFAPELLAGL